MNHRLQLRIRPVEGSLIRALGLAERRGFQLVSVSFQGLVDAAHVLELVVRSPDRPVAVLGRQLARLHDVLEVMIAAPAQLDGARAAGMGGT